MWLEKEKEYTKLNTLERTKNPLAPYKATILPQCIFNGWCADRNCRKSVHDDCVKLADLELYDDGRGPILMDVKGVIPAGTTWA